MVTGFPFTWAVVTVFPCVLATTRVLPDEDGVGSSKSISMQSLLSLISTFIAINGSPLDLLVDRPGRNRIGFVRAKNRRAGIYFSSPSVSAMDEQLELLYFGCRWSFGALLNLEVDTISFSEALKTFTFDGTMVNKDIFAAII
jgi:hypothetical protein